MSEEWQVLVRYKRAGLTEIAVHGALAWAHGNEVIHRVGRPQPLFGRSLIKPWQMKAIAAELSPLLNQEQKALALASHMAEPRQLAVLQAMLSTEEASFLQTPAVLPIGKTAHAEPSRWNHPCAGKHAAVIRACSVLGWDRGNYLHADHPYQQRLAELLGSYRANNVEAADGCGMPTVAFELGVLAKMFASLLRQKDDDWVWRTMCAEPELIGGKERLDTAILKAGAGKVLAKEGADGLLGMAIEHPKYPEGLGVVLKIAHGWDAGSMWLCAREILRSLGVELPEQSVKEHTQASEVSYDIVP